MKTFGQVAAAFGLMVVAGYVAMVTLVPAPTMTEWRPDDMTGADAAARLSQQAESLVSHRPAASLQ